MKKLIISLLTIGLFVGIVSGFVYFFQKDDSAQDAPNVNDDVEKEPANEPNPVEEQEPEPEPEPVVTTATLAGVGDILIHSSLYKDAQTGNGTYDFKPMFELVKPYIESADISFANQETMLGGTELGLSSYPMFNSPYEVGDALLDIGIDVVSIANNHTLDAGEKGILNAIGYYNSNGLLYTGAYESVEDRAKVRTIERNGIVFSFLAYTYGTNGIPVPSGKDYLVNLIDVDAINEEIIRAKEVSDVVVLSLHFGNEYQPLPNETQKFLAAEFAKTGADIILGHHPHVLQPMEWLVQEDGRKTFVVYSLGNFISGQEGIKRLIGGIVQLEVEKTTLGDEVTIDLRSPKFVPVYTYRNGWRNYKLYPMHEISQPNILSNVESHLEKAKKHMSLWMPELMFEQ